ncbi:MAG: DUF2953 domain-containing protein [Clostridia bacterium]|nr:DUF2953 domain-containing protein [Clostridia bacterium]
MKALWLILLVPLFLLLVALFIRVRFRIKAESDVKLILELPFFRMQLFPEKEKRPNPRSFTREGLKKQILKERKKADRQNKKKAAKAAKKQARKEAAQTAAPKKKMPLTEIIELVTLLVNKLLSNLSRRLRIDVRRLHVTVATGDAATTAIAYGAVSAAMAGLTEVLYLNTRTKLPKPENGGVYADFVGDTSRADIEIVLSIRVIGVLATLFSLAYNYLKKQFFAKMKG